METQRNFPALSGLLGENVSFLLYPTLIKKAQDLLGSGETMKAFLLARMAYLQESNQDAVNIIEVCTRVSDLGDIPETVPPTEKVLENNLFLSQTIDYKTLIQHCVLYPNHSTTLLELLLIKQEERYAGRQIFLDNMIEFLMTHKDAGRWVWAMFSQVCEFVASYDTKKDVLRYLAKKLMTPGHRPMVRCFYEYYSYLGMDQIADTLFSVFVENPDPTDADVQTVFTEKYFWLNDRVSAITLQNKCEKVIDAKNGEFRKGINYIFYQNTLPSLIPLCLYAQARGMVEVEAAALWYAVRITNAPKLLERLSEISGVQIPEEFISMRLEDRVNWFERCLRHTMSLERASSIRFSEYERSLKMAYALQPFNTTILKGLVVLTMADDEEAEKMLAHSVGMMTASLQLSSLLIFAHRGSLFGVRLLVRRLIEREHYRTLLLAIRYCAKHISDKVALPLVQEALGIYLVAKSEGCSYRTRRSNVKLEKLLGKTMTLIPLP